MKTVTFYSYKGGTGRTLLLANTALYLASIGKSVVMLDLDLEAPGLPYKFDREDFPNGDADWPPQRGIVTQLAAYIRKDIQSLDVPSLAVKLRRRNEQHGFVRLIPAGPAPSEGYLADLAGTDWHSFYWGASEIRNTPAAGVWLNAFETVKRQIETAFSPHYLLVDSRTGLADIAGVCLNVLPEKIVMLVLPNNETLDGTRKVIDIARGAAAGKKPKRNVDVLVALARMSRLHSRNEAEEKMSQVRSSLEAPVVCLHSDQDLEVRERLLFPSEDVTLRESALLRDYLTFFEAFDDEAFKRTAPDRLLGLIKATTVEGIDASEVIDEGRGLDNGPRLRAEIVHSRKQLWKVDAHFLKGADTYRDFYGQVIERLVKACDVKESKPIDKDRLNYNILGGQIREGLFDFCGEAYFLTPLRREGSEVIQFGELQSFCIVWRKDRTSVSFDVCADYDTVEKALEPWLDAASKHHSVLEVAMLGDAAATSESSRFLITRAEAAIFSRRDESDIEAFLSGKDTPAGSVKGASRIALVDHGIFKSFEEGPYGSSRVRFANPLPVGFVLPRGDRAWRRVVAEAVAKALWQLTRDRWTRIRNELENAASIEAFTFDKFCRYLALDMTSSHAENWLEKTVGRNVGADDSDVRVG